MLFNLGHLEETVLLIVMIKEASLNGSDRFIQSLSIIAAAILLIALINYINLSTSKAVDRAKEVGLRKSLGAGRFNLIGQFFAESSLFNILAVLLSLLLIAFFADPLNEVLGSRVVPSDWYRKPEIWAVIAGLFGTTCLIAGIYPAVVLSSIHTREILKGKFSNTGKGHLFRKGLVIFQFSVSIVLIACTIIVFRQLSFMQNKDLGFKPEQMLVIKAPTLFEDINELSQKAEVFKDKLRGFAAVRHVTSSNEVPGRTLEYNMPIRKSSDPDESNVATYWISTDEFFLDTYQTQLVAGRNFRQSDASAVNPNSTNRVIINEKTARLLGFAQPEEAIQQQIVLWNKTPAEVIGVVENFHQMSLKEDYVPLLFQYPTYYQTLYFDLKLNTVNLDNTISFIRVEYENLFPDNPFEYFFLDDYFNSHYRAEQQMGRASLLFSGLAIFIACMGLFGLASFDTMQRTKEIGIRKTMGASVTNILALLSFSFTRLILVSGFIAVPLAYVGMERWLENYTFRIEMNWWLLALPVILVFVAAMAAVGFHTIKASLANPVDSLKYE